MEKITFKSKDLQTGKTVMIEGLHDDNLTNRAGYDVNFLGKKVKLPTKSSKNKDRIAFNNNPGRNGKNYLDYLNYSVMLNKDKKLPFFSAVNIEGKSNELAGIHEARGSDSWFQDKRICADKECYQFDNKDYAGSGFQKGHMTRFYDPAWGENSESKKIAMGDTFYYTNCCPQIGKYNAGIWNDLEDYYMARAIFQDEKITVFTGPILKDAIQVGKLLVPMHFWKVLVYKIKGKIEAMAFLITHEFAMTKLFKAPIEDQLVPKEEGFDIFKMVNPTLDVTDIKRLYEEKNLKKWVVKIEYIELKTGLLFGLNRYDVNRIEDLYFNINVAKLDDSSSKLKMVLQNQDAYFTLRKTEDKDTEFLRKI